VYHTGFNLNLEQTFLARLLLFNKNGGSVFALDLPSDTSMWKDNSEMILRELIIPRVLDPILKMFESQHWGSKIVPATLRDYIFVKVPVGSLTYKAYMFQLDFLHGRKNIPVETKIKHPIAISKTSRSSSLMVGLTYITWDPQVIVLFSPGFFETNSTGIYAST